MYEVFKRLVYLAELAEICFSKMRNPYDGGRNPPCTPPPPPSPLPPPHAICPMFHVICIAQIYVGCTYIRKTVWVHSITDPAWHA
jgi:hypothetical protein